MRGTTRREEPEEHHGARHLCTAVQVKVRSRWRSEATWSSANGERNRRVNAIASGSDDASWQRAANYLFVALGIFYCGEQTEQLMWLDASGDMQARTDGRWQYFKSLVKTDCQDEESKSYSANIIDVLVVHVSAGRREGASAEKEVTQMKLGNDQCDGRKTYNVQARAPIYALTGFIRDMQAQLNLNPTPGFALHYALRAFLPVSTIEAHATSGVVTDPFTKSTIDEKVPDKSRGVLLSSLAPSHVSAPKEPVCQLQRNIGYTYCLRF